MAVNRPLLQVSLWGLGAALVLGGMGSWTRESLASNLDWEGAHRSVALYAFLAPAMLFLHLHALDRTLERRASPIKVNFRAWAWGFGGAMAAFAHLIPDPASASLGRAFAGLLLVGAAGATTGLVLRLLPRPNESVVNIARDPLTKGDDASLALVRFAHYLLPLGVLLSLWGHGWFGSMEAWHAELGTGAMPDWMPRVGLAGDHVLLAGYGLLSLFGLSHLWVPRLSGVPAIAAGAIKGELHSMRLGIVLVPLGLALQETWMLVVGGMAVFVAAFTFMGTLGANIMKNKSPTQRITPQFNYVPWTFAGAFWIISGVLLGIFLRVVPTTLADYAAGLRFAHAHSLLAGGFVLLFLGYLLKLLPAWTGGREPSFHATRWSFYSLNLGLALLVIGELTSGRGGRTFQLGALLAVVGLGAWFFPVWKDYRTSEAAR